MTRLFTTLRLKSNNPQWSGDFTFRLTETGEFLGCECSIPALNKRYKVTELGDSPLQFEDGGGYQCFYKLEEVNHATNQNNTQ